MRSKVVPPFRRPHPNTCSEIDPLGIAGNESLGEDDQPRSTTDCLACQVQGFHRAALPVEGHGAGLHHRNAKQVHVALSYTQTPAHARVGLARRLQSSQESAFHLPHEDSSTRRLSWPCELPTARKYRHVE